MAYCQNCGGEMADGAKFCPSCGTAAGSAGNERKTSYEGEIKKCPTCGAVLSSMQAFCPDCGFELNGRTGSDAVKEFQEGLTSLNARLAEILSNSNLSEDERDYAEEAMEKQIASHITVFPVPNTVQDITEFMLIASQNMTSQTNVNGAVTKAWEAKAKQVYEKAKISFGKQANFKQIETLYFEAANKAQKEKKKLYLMLGLLVGGSATVLIIISILQKLGLF